MSSKSAASGPAGARSTQSRKQHVPDQPLRLTSRSEHHAPRRDRPPIADPCLVAGRRAVHERHHRAPPRRPPGQPGPLRSGRILSPSYHSPHRACLVVCERSPRNAATSSRISRHALDPSRRSGHARRPNPHRPSATSSSSRPAVRAARSDRRWQRPRAGCGRSYRDPPPPTQPHSTRTTRLPVERDLPGESAAI